MTVRATPEDEATPGAALGRFPLHVVFIAVWPALSLWSTNATEVRAQEAWPFVWGPAAVAIALTALFALPLRRDLRRSALLISVLTIVALLGGRVVQAPPVGVTMGVLAVVAVIGGIVARRLSQAVMVPTTAITNVLAGILVLLTLPAIIPTLTGEGGSDAAAIAAEGGTRSDIWYVIPDRYPRADTLDQVFAYDNGPFLDALADRGFDIGTEALTNYPKTAHSLASTWNLDYLDELVDLDAQPGDDWGALYALLRDHRLGRTLQEAGYTYDHLGTWWSPTALSTIADQNIRLDARSEFAGVWLTSTLGAAWASTDTTPGATGTEIREGFRDLNFDYTSFQLDALDRLAAGDADTPRFVMAHVTQPHEPYVFDSDGSRVSRDAAEARTREDNLVRQVEHLNDRLLATVDTILARDPDAVIVIQSDEGPHPRERTGPSFDWVAASDAALQEKLRIVSAIRLPGGPDLPDDRTAVNTWRWILNTVIGTDLAILPDRVAVYPGDDALYTLVDVTDRVQ